jgi:hypothetical protein
MNSHTTKRGTAAPLALAALLLLLAALSACESNIPKAVRYPITVANPATGGSVTASRAEAAAGDTVTLTIHREPGYSLTALRFVPALTPEWVAANTRTFTMPAAAVTITPVFTFGAQTYEVRVGQVGAGGSIAITPAGPQAEGQDITVTAAPEPGYELAALTVTRFDTDAQVAVSGTGNTRTFTLPDSHVTVSASFRVAQGYVVTELTGFNNPALPIDIVTSSNWLYFTAPQGYAMYRWYVSGWAIMAGSTPADVHEFNIGMFNFWVGKHSVTLIVRDSAGVLYSTEAYFSIGLAD